MQLQVCNFKCTQHLRETSSRLHRSFSESVLQISITAYLLLVSSNKERVRTRVVACKCWFLGARARARVRVRAFVCLRCVPLCC
jgi:hypothetical protein